MSQIKVGVIGCGYWGPNLIRNFVEIPTSDVLAVADLREERLSHIKTRYPQVTVTEDYRDLFTLGLDAVVVATPPATHFPLARDCLRHGLHVLVEKPFTLVSRHAEELIELAEARGLILMAGHTFEYNPAVRALKRIVDSGELGQIYYIDAVRVNLGLFQPDLNVLWDLASHDVSILLYILSRAPIAVSAQGMACVFDGIHDIVYLNLVFPGDVLAHLHASWLDPCKVRRVTVVGSKKMVVYDDVSRDAKIVVYDKGIDKVNITDSLGEFESFGEFQLRVRAGDMYVPEIDFVEPLKVECAHFIDCIVNGKKPLTDGEEGYGVVKILEGAQTSLEKGGAPVEIPW